MGLADLWRRLCADEHAVHRDIFTERDNVVFLMDVVYFESSRNPFFFSAVCGCHYSILPYSKRLKHTLQQASGNLPP